MSARTANAASESPVYAFRPSLLGARWEFGLSEEGIDWVAGRRSGHIPYRDIRRVRMSFRPASMQLHRFVTELWAAGAPKIRIVSTSWKSMVEQERLDRSYAGFVTELHRHLAVAAPPARYEQGGNPLLYWPGLLVFAGAAMGFAVLVVRALQSAAFGGAAIVGAFLLLFLWQAGDFFRRNRPGHYRPEALPSELMPKY